MIMKWNVFVPKNNGLTGCGPHNYWQTRNSGNEWHNVINKNKIDICWHCIQCHSQNLILYREEKPLNSHSFIKNDHCFIDVSLERSHRNNCCQMDWNGTAQTTKKERNSWYKLIRCHMSLFTTLCNKAACDRFPNNVRKNVFILRFVSTAFWTNLRIQSWEKKVSEPHWPMTTKTLAAYSTNAELC